MRQSDAAPPHDAGRICAAAGWRRSARRWRPTSSSAPAQDHGVVPVIYEDDVHPYTDLAVGPRGRRAAGRRAGRARRVAQSGPREPAGRHGRRSLRRDPRAGERGAARPHRRAAAGGDAGRPARSDLPQVEDVERRPAAPVRARAGRRRPGPSPDARTGPAQAPPSRPAPESAAAATMRYLPALLRAAVITLLLSLVSMALAVATGLGDRDRPRVRRPGPSQSLLTGVGGARARHAAAAAALRPLLRPGSRRAAAGVGRRRCSGWG